MFCAGVGKEITDRLAAVLEHVQAEYVVFTLDDYFLTEPIDQGKIDRAISFMDDYRADYIQLYPQPRDFLRRDGAKETKDYTGIYLLDLFNGGYKVVLTPGIWRTEFMRKTLTGTLNAWQYEVSLTESARSLNAVCATSNCGEFPYLDVVRKGKVLPKADRYFRKHPIYETSQRGILSWKKDVELRILTAMKFWLPKWMLRGLKRLMMLLGRTFYSPV